MIKERIKKSIFNKKEIKPNIEKAIEGAIEGGKIKNDEIMDEINVITEIKEIQKKGKNKIVIPFKNKPKTINPNLNNIRLIL